LISRFFIDRPIFAAVLSIVITLAGGIAVTTLPIAMYPPIAPPTVQVDCSFPGASAQVVAETVATPIEQQVNGVENMLYMSSQCTNDGAYNLTVTFKHGVDLNMAQVLVQNRVSLAVPLLPDVIKQTGVTTRKKSPDILLALALTSPDKTRDQLFLSNYALTYVLDEVARIEGVSDVRVLGQRDYSMRIWVDPEKLAARDMTAADVTNAIRKQNIQVATGQIGQPPIPDGQQTQVPLSTLGRLSEPEQYEQMIVKTLDENRVVRVRDIARVELGAKNQDISGSVNGRPAVSLAIFQLPDANALDTAMKVKEKIAELAEDFPTGVGWEVRYDTTPFISESIAEVFKTLREAIILVAVVVLLFLQNWRSAVIPLVAVPVAIIGTFAVLAVMGFSLNNLTLFGLVLAIGIVVDDAIVVVEAVEHHIEHGMTPRDATIRAMDEVSGPVIAIALVLSAVFVPCAFISGIVGQFFRQFALTIATSTIISAFNSLTLSPALAAILIKPKDPAVRQVALPRIAYVVGGALAGYFLLAPFLMGQYWEELEPKLVDRFDFLVPLAEGTKFNALVDAYPDTNVGLTLQIGSVILCSILGWFLGWGLDRALVWFFGVFNNGFRLATKGYSFVVSLFLKGSVAALILYGGLLYLTYDRIAKTPAGFIPTQDMGYLLANVQLSDSVSLERTKATLDKCERIARDTPGVRFTQAVTGQSMLLSANGSNFGSMFCIFDPFDKRHNRGTFGSDLRLISKLDDESQIPRDGDDLKKLVILADVKGVLYFRIFHADGMLLVNTNEMRLKNLNAGFGLRVMPSLNDPSQIPTAGKKQVILASVNNQIHVRIFDVDGSTLVDTDAAKLAKESRPVGTLTREYEGLLRPGELPEPLKIPAIQSIAALLGKPGSLPTTEETDFRVLTSLNGVNSIPTTGNNQVLVAVVNDVLHFRAFDASGKMIVDTDEKKLEAESRPVLAFKKKNEGWWAPRELTDAEKVQAIDTIMPVVARTRSIPILSLKQKLKGFWPPNEISEAEKKAVVAKVNSIIGPIHLEGEAIIADLRERFAISVPEAVTTVLGPPPVRGVGRAGGFKLMVEDRGANSLSTLQGQTDNLVDKARIHDRERDNELKGKMATASKSPKNSAPSAVGLPIVTSLAATFRANVPQYFVDVNRAECMTKDVKLQDLFDTLRIYLGSLYVNDFNRFGRTWQVIVQADPKFRNTIDYVPRLKVRNSQGTMVPVGTVASLKQINGPLVLTRYNMYPAAPINGAAAAGISSGEAIATMEALGKRELLNSMTTEWTELAYLELQAGNTAFIVFGFAVVMVFLVLAAQYESWSMPLAIILVVPMCLLSAVIGVNIAGEDINIFTQIGFVVLVGLASKNAILIVEFAKSRRDVGVSRYDAAMEACRLRLRPIIMTSFAFILGVLPLLTGHGAGAEMRRTLGTTVFSGMLGVTLFGIFLTPMFFFVIDWMGETKFFASPVTRRILGGPLWLLSLKFLRRGGRRSGPWPVKTAPVSGGELE
jgi:multidrug efflux pump subunit AcrB